MFRIVVVVGVSVLENPYEPRGGTCGPGVRRAACLFEVPACSTGWAPFGVSCFGVLRNSCYLLHDGPVLA